MNDYTETIPDLTSQSFKQAKNDQFETKSEKILSEKAPELSKFINKETIYRSEADLRSTVNHLVSQTDDIIIDIDEVECPHCEGRGTTGLIGDLCAYCKGSCVVTEEDAESYDPEDIDEVTCPHCEGRGTTGLVGNICAFCKGSCVVTDKEAESYDPENIDEVKCPHCEGRGTTGLVGDICKLCRGSCVVTEGVKNAYFEKYGR